MKKLTFYTLAYLLFMRNTETKDLLITKMS